MTTYALSDYLDQLPEKHQECLRWFNDRKGQSVSWPGQHENGWFLTQKAKGIHKPKDSIYALSIRESPNGPYDDAVSQEYGDGSWTYAYHPERPPAGKSWRDVPSNAALIRAYTDAVPIAMVRKTGPRKSDPYRVYGLALIIALDAENRFILQGFSASESIALDAGTDLLRDMSGTIDTLAAAAIKEDVPAILNALRKTVREITIRRGQPQFRKQLLTAYDDQCAFTRCHVADALEAAHITPFAQVKEHRLSNGLPLRADIHTLFDLGLVSVRPDRRELCVASAIRDSEYGALAGAPLLAPRNVGAAPDTDLLELHYLSSRARN